MNKLRRKMTEAEVVEQEYWKSLRSQKNQELKFAMMLEHCGGQCEESMESGKPCPNKHGQAGVTIRGTVILSVVNSTKPYLQCQKCGFEAMKKKLAEPIRVRVTRKKANPDQVLLV